MLNEPAHLSSQTTISNVYIINATVHHKLFDRLANMCEECVCVHRLHLHLISLFNGSILISNLVSFAQMLLITVFIKTEATRINISN